MKIETKHWVAASKMMIAAGKAMSPEAITLDVHQGNWAGKKGGKDGKDGKGKDNNQTEIPDTAGENAGTTDTSTIKQQPEPNETVESLRINSYEEP
jgi:hypothetical protein